MQKNENTYWHHSSVTRNRRETLNGHRSTILWFTGLSGSGKSTLAHAVEEYLHQHNCRTFVLDGDNVRHGLCADLSFSNADRTENIRRIGETAKLMVEAGIITLTAFISPFRQDRQLARNLFPHGDFLEVYCNASLDVCEVRDVKGLYKRAREGEVKDFTGISSPYEAPQRPELEINTGEHSLESGVNAVVNLLQQRGILQPV
jgi:adenylylsulfate kinase